MYSMSVSLTGRARGVEWQLPPRHRPSEGCSTNHRSWKSQPCPQLHHCALLQIIQVNTIFLHLCPFLVWTSSVFLSVSLPVSLLLCPSDIFCLPSSPSVSPQSCWPQQQSTVSCLVCHRFYFTAATALFIFSLSSRHHLLCTFHFLSFPLSLHSLVCDIQHFLLFMSGQ